MLKYYLTSLLKAHLTLEGCNFNLVFITWDFRFITWIYYLGLLYNRKLLNCVNFLVSVGEKILNVKVVFPFRALTGLYIP